MAYANGREAGNGDKVMGKNTNGDPVAGILINISGGLGIVVPLILIADLPVVAVNNLNHIDDVIIQEEQGDSV